MVKIQFKELALLSLVFVLASCKIDIPKEVPTSFETITVEKRDISVPMKFSARLKGQSDVTIMPQVSGQLMKIAVSEGQQVTKGQVLFVIDSRNAQLELEAAQANLQAALASENSAKLEFESNKNLYEKNIASRYMMDNAENSYKRAQSSVAQARASVDRARVNLGFCTIKSPVTGVIGEIPVKPGDQVSPGLRLTIVSGNQQMDAEFSIPETILEYAVANGYNLNTEESVKQMPEVTFVMKNGTEYPHKGRLSSATGVVNSATGTIAIKATFPNPDGVLFSGVQGTVVMQEDKENVMIVPQTAVVRLQDKSLVYKVQADSTVTAVTVTTEDVGNGQDFIVTSGLNVGDRIVSVGANNLQEGQQVLFPQSNENEK